MSRPRKNRILLSDSDVDRVIRLLEEGNCSKTIKQRCFILLDLDENHEPVLTQEECAAKRNLSRATVANIASLFSKEGLNSVLTIKRNENSNRARTKVTPEIESKILALVEKPAPEGHSKWSLRLLEKAISEESQFTVGRETIRKVIEKYKL